MKLKLREIVIDETMGLAKEQLDKAYAGWVEAAVVAIAADADESAWAADAYVAVEAARDKYRNLKQEFENGK